jgi:hypothetical protein
MVLSNKVNTMLSKEDNEANRDIAKKAMGTTLSYSTG